jgi:hypothetical protein
MDIGTLALAAGFDIYLIVLALVAREDIARFGPAMIAGVCAGFAALVLGEVAVLGNSPRLGVLMAVASVASAVLVSRALWCRRGLLSPHSSESDELL